MLERLSDSVEELSSVRLSQGAPVIPIPAIETVQDFQQFLYINREAQSYSVYPQPYQHNGSDLLIFASESGGNNGIILHGYPKGRETQPFWVTVKMFIGSLDDSHHQRFSHEITFLKRRTEQVDPYWVHLIPEGTVPYHSVGSEHYIMECLMPGVNLDTVIVSRPEILQNPHFVAAVALQIADALARVHAEGSVLRDLKLRNIMLVRPSSSRGFVRLVDPGIALSPYRRPRQITPADQSVGTPCVMAPEQWECSQVGPAADMYAFGCLLHEIICGDVPFMPQIEKWINRFRVRLNLEDLVEQLMEDCTLRGIISSKKISAAAQHSILATLTCQLLNKNPEKRPSAADVVRSLQPLVADSPYAGIVGPAINAL